MKTENIENISLWDASAEEKDLISDIDGDLAAELVILGAGLTGLSTALHAAEKGIACRVLEPKKSGMEVRIEVPD